MARRKARQDGGQKAKRPRLPDRDRLYISEVAKVVAAELGISDSGARSRLYRGIEAGDVKAVRVLGTLMIPRGEVERILAGEAP